jgi:PH and SEC7 domain-containing protein
MVSDGKTSSGFVKLIFNFPGITRTCDAAGFRTSKSEDHLQHTQHRDGGIGAAIVPIDIDEDVNSSLNTLLDTRHDSSEDNSDRIVWTYNAPQASGGGGGGGITSPPISHSPHTNSNSPSSPQRTDSSVASPTSVSSSIMSSSGSRNGGYGNGGSNPMTCSGNSGGGFHSLLNPQNSIGGGEMSISEAISNISSPDYQDEHDLPSSRDLAMALTDPSDSDSTLLVSETTHQVHDRDRDKGRAKRNKSSDSKNLFTYDLPGGYTGDYDNQDIRQPSMIMMQPDLKDSEDELATLTEDIAMTLAMGQQEPNGRDSSPPISDDGSDVDSLHSFHYSPKAVDLPSAIRLAKRLYSLDGFKKSDVSRHLSKK